MLIDVPEPAARQVASDVRLRDQEYVNGAVPPLTNAANE